MAFTIEASDHHGARAYPVGSAREAIDVIADLLNADLTIDRLSDRDGQTVQYDDIVRARYPSKLG